MLNKLLIAIVGLLFSTATMAAEATPRPQQSIGSMIIMFIVFIAIFYFLLIRPQQKKAKDQRDLMNQLSVGDEVITAGGIVGRILRLRDNFIVLSIAKDSELTLQKSSVGSILPKGTLEFSE